MQAPGWLTRAVDPATAYLRHRSPEPAGPVSLGTAVFGPGVAGGARQATPAELEPLRGEAASRRTEPSSRVELDPAVLHAARDLVVHGATMVRQTVSS